MTISPGASLPAREQIESAASFLAPLVPPTPQYLWPQVAAAFGTQVWLKHENHTPIGAFKARSAAIYFRKLMEREPACPGVITATRGNHGQAVGLAARRFKLPATVYVPHGNGAEKNAAMRALGVTLVEHGQDFQEAREEAGRVGAQRALHMVPAFHPDMVLGVSTYWAELFRAVPDLDVVYVPIGQGSGICAASAARNAYSPRTQDRRRGLRACALLLEVLRCAPRGRGAGRDPARRRHGLPQARCGSAWAIVLANVSRIVEVTDAELGGGHAPTCSRSRTTSPKAPAPRHSRRPGASASRSPASASALALTGGNVDSALFADVLAGKYWSLNIA